MDDFGARYFNSLTGRFQSPDWANKAEPVPYAKLDNPQTLNLYVYVANSPESSADLDGHRRSELADIARRGGRGGDMIPISLHSV